MIPKTSEFLEALCLMSFRKMIDDDARDGRPPPSAEELAMIAARLPENKYAVMLEYMKQLGYKIGR